MAEEKKKQGTNLGTKKAEDVKSSKKEKVKKAKSGKSNGGGSKPNPGTRPFTIYSMKERERYLKGIVYGEYGVGKTTLVASADDIPAMRDVLMINVEAGDMAVQHRSRMDVITPTSFDQFSKVHKYLRNHCKYRDEDTEEAKQQLLKLERYLKGDDSIQEPKRYNTVIIDSLSEVQKLSMYKLLGINLESYNLSQVPESPEYKEWNIDTEMIRLLMRLFRNLPMNVLAVAGPRTDQDNKKRIIYSPGLSKALSKEVQGFVDFVGFYVAGRTEGGSYKRRLWLNPGDTFAAKNRFRNFDEDFIDAPTMRDLWDIIQEYGVED